MSNVIRFPGSPYPPPKALSSAQQASSRVPVTLHLRSKEAKP
jgi:hypothetical protein